LFGRVAHLTAAFSILITKMGAPSFPSLGEGWETTKPALSYLSLYRSKALYLKFHIHIPFHIFFSLLFYRKSTILPERDDIRNESKSLYVLFSAAWPRTAGKASALSAHGNQRALVH
jgi:hypothetical protein